MPSDQHIKVGIIEDDKMIRQSLSQAIELHPLMTLSFASRSVEEGLEEISDFQFIGVDILLQDIGLPGMSGLQALQPIKHKLPDVDIIMLTTYDEVEKIFEALQKGACSYISKKTSLKVILEAIVIVHRGGSYMSPSIARKIADNLRPKPKKDLEEKLTKKQYQIVEGLAQGLSYKMIAADQGISIDTVRSHIKKVYKTLHVNSKIEVLNMF
ncbi:MAG: response regulator transcription factor, partial [Bacteroidota bacterium]